ncbi:Protein spaetzle [Pseudolycoriella hygida]|uniref:Protein spaetzle n=1 Tax=Pseudolycoriella hygida TaxID=35572 RepID=A0A9Q0MJW9_9DIPT|nr:Protein spaetzle [Pseudolycoriella hygida]
MNYFVVARKEFNRKMKMFCSAVVMSVLLLNGVQPLPYKIKSRPHITTKVRFVYDEHISDRRLSFVPEKETIRCAKGSTFCEQVADYPASEVDVILKKDSHRYEELFGEELTPIVIANRFGEEEEEEQICASSTRLIFPRMGLNIDNTWRYIVNQKNYKQGIRIDECMHKGECNMMNHLPFGYKSKCKQKYVYRQLVAIDDNGKTTKELFQLPSCCQCVLVRNSF